MQLFVMEITIVLELVLSFPTCSEKHPSNDISLYQLVSSAGSLGDIHHDWRIDI